MENITFTFFEVGVRIASAITCTTVCFIHFFLWYSSTPELRSDWNVSCDHGLDYAR